MKKIISVLGLILLAACSQQPEFSIAESDKLQDIAKNPVFEDIKSSPQANKDNAIFKFKSVPKSLFGLKTDDVNIVGGYLQFNKNTNRLCYINVTIKDKKSYGMLRSRLKEAYIDKGKALYEYDSGFEQGTLFGINHEGKGTAYATLGYDPLSDYTMLSFVLFDKCITDKR